MKKERVGELKISTFSEIEEMYRVFSLDVESIDRIIEFTLRENIRITGSSASFLAFINSKEDRIGAVSSLNIDDKGVEKFSMYAQRRAHVSDSFFIKHVIESREPKIINEKADLDPSFEYPDSPLHDRYVTVPLFRHKHIEAVIGVAGRKSSYGKEELYNIILLSNGLSQIHIRLKLEAFDNLLSSIVIYSKDAIFSCSLDGTINTWNRGAEKMFGYSEDEIFGKSLDLLTYPEMPNEFPLIFEQIKKGEAVENYETVRMKKDGSKIDLSLTVSPLMDNNKKINGASIIARDITEKKEAMRAIKRSEERYRAIFENTGTGSIVVSDDRVITHVNREFVKMLGYFREEIEGKMTGADFVIKEDLPKIFKFHELRRQKGEEAPRNYELRIIDRSGTMKEVYTTSEVIPATGETIVSFMDITEMKKLQHDVLNICDQEKIKLSQTLRDSLVQNLNLLIKKCDTKKGPVKLNEEINEIIEKVKEITGGLIPLDFKKLSFYSSLMKMIKTLSDMHEVNIQADISKDAEIDEDNLGAHLFFIIQESLLKAIIDGKASKLGVRLKEEGDWIILTITTNGSALPDLLKQSDDYDFRVIIYRASLIGAFIDVMENRDGSSTVTFRFKSSKISIPTGDKVQHAKSKFSEGKSTISIVLIDSSPIVRQGLIDILNREKDFKIAGEADSQEKGLKIVERISPDLVIMDINLNDDINLDLVKAMRTRYPKMKLLIFSMCDWKMYAERYIKSGADGFLRKDERLNVILKAIYEILSGKKYLNDEYKKELFDRSYGRDTEEDNTPVKLLTDREFEVFNLIGKGLGPREIADKLRLSVKTIETYRERIKEKLGLANASELLQYSIQWVINNKSSDNVKE